MILLILNHTIPMAITALVSAIPIPHKSAGDYIYQDTEHTINPGNIYMLKLWAHSINGGGNTEPTVAEARFYSGSTTIGISRKNVNAKYIVLS
jgi:hypothetical protein